jgi:hypothetical protein
VRKKPLRKRKMATPCSATKKKRRQGDVAVTLSLIFAVCGDSSFLSSPTSKNEIKETSFFLLFSIT